MTTPNDNHSPSSSSSSPSSPTTTDRLEALRQRQQEEFDRLEEAGKAQLAKHSARIRQLQFELEEAGVAKADAQHKSDKTDRELKKVTARVERLKAGRSLSSAQSDDGEDDAAAKQQQALQELMASIREREWAVSVAERRKKKLANELSRERARLEECTQKEATVDAKKRSVADEVAQLRGQLTEAEASDLTARTDAQKQQQLLEQESREFARLKLALQAAELQSGQHSSRLDSEAQAKAAAVVECERQQALARELEVKLAAARSQYDSEQKDALEEAEAARTALMADANAELKKTDECKRECQLAETRARALQEAIDQAKIDQLRQAAKQSGIKAAMRLTRARAHTLEDERCRLERERSRLEKQIAELTPVKQKLSAQCERLKPGGLNGQVVTGGGTLSSSSQATAPSAATNGNNGNGHFQPIASHTQVATDDGGGNGTPSQASQATAPSAATNGNNGNGNGQPVAALTQVEYADLQQSPRSPSLSPPASLDSRVFRRPNPVPTSMSSL